MRIKKGDKDFTVNELQALRIIEIVNNYFILECRDVNRKLSIVYPRQIAMYLIDKYVKVTKTTNAKLFKKTHACVNNSNKVIYDILSSKLRCDKESIKEIEILSDLAKETYCLLSQDNEVFYLKSKLSNLIYNMDLEQLKDLQNQLIKNEPLQN